MLLLWKAWAQTSKVSFQIINLCRLSQSDSRLQTMPANEIFKFVPVGLANFDIVVNMCLTHRAQCTCSANHYLHVKMISTKYVRRTMA